MKLERIWPEGVYVRTEPHLSGRLHTQVVRSSGAGARVDVAGTLPFDRDGRLVGLGSMRLQVRAVMDNIGKSLVAAGASPADVVRTKTYVTDLAAYLREGHEEWLRFFGESRPASTTVQVVTLVDPDALVEIEAYAEIA